MREHTILVAVTVEADSREQAQQGLIDWLPGVGQGSPVESWWIAEDDRIDRSDNDSAVFCHMGEQEAASQALRAKDLTAGWNVVHRA